MNEKKTCRVCNRELGLKLFTKKHDNADGLSTICRACKSKYDSKHLRKKRIERRDKNGCL